MNVDDYQIAYKGEDKYLLYFSQFPLKLCKYPDFELHFQALPIPPSKKTLISSYKLCLAQIKDNKETPPFVKEKIEMFLKDVSDQDFNKKAILTFQGLFIAYHEFFCLCVNNLPYQPRSIFSGQLWQQQYYFYFKF